MEEVKNPSISLIKGDCFVDIPAEYLDPKNADPDHSAFDYFLDKDLDGSLSQEMQMETAKAELSAGDIYCLKYLFRASRLSSCRKTRLFRYILNKLHKSKTCAYECSSVAYKKINYL